MNNKKDATSFETVYGNLVRTKEDDKMPSNANSMNSSDNKDVSNGITKFNNTSICYGTSIWFKRVDSNEQKNSSSICSK